MNTSTLITDIVPLRDYFLTDALGSVRQLTDAQGQVTLANAYEPYGVLAQSAGSAQTSYGFTGEFTDPSGLVYLRARYYAPQEGRFTSKDTWGGNTHSPLSFNRWAYVYGNPINYTDPSGHDPWWCDAQPDPEACYDQYLPRVNARVYYLNQIGNAGGYAFKPNPDPFDEQGYILYRVTQIVGEQNVKSIPIYTNLTIGNILFIPGNPFCTRIEMLLEAYGLQIWSPTVASAISADLRMRPLKGGERLVIIGNSGGGTIAIEALDLLQEENIFVNQVILRGSPVHELRLSNVGRVDYITANFFFFNLLPSDHYYSFDSNPFDDVVVEEHRIDFEDPPPNHVPPNEKINKKIANLIVQLIVEGARK